MHERFSDLRAIVIVQSLLRDGGVQFDLTIQNRLYIFNFYLIGKIQDVFDCQFGFIHSSNIVRFVWIIQNYFTVLFDMGDVGVLMLDSDRSVMSAFDHFGCDVEVVYILNKRAGTDFLCNQFFREGNVFGSYFTEYFQSFVSISTDDAENSCNVNSFKSAGIRNSNTFNILNDVSTQKHFYRIRKFSENLACFCRCISNGNRFCTSECRYQLLFQDVQIVCI